jgi:hypothetical protein
MSGGEAFRRSSHQPLELLEGLDSLRIPGGCPDCDAYQEFDTSQAPIYRLLVRHDETCPAYRAMKDDR